MAGGCLCSCAEVWLRHLLSFLLSIKFVVGVSTGAALSGVVELPPRKHREGDQEQRITGSLARGGGWEGSN